MLLCCLCFCAMAYSQQENEKTNESTTLAERVSQLESITGTLKKIKISGYIQTQYQHGEKDALLKVGTRNESREESFDRMGIRRGRVKVSYEEGLLSGVFQLDMTEKGVFLRDAYFNAKDPWWGTSSLRLGVYNLPFGYEVTYSSSRRESPERAAVLEALFPDMRDLGALVQLRPSKTSPLHFLQLDMGVFAGNGIQQETDSRKDFLAHLSAKKEINNLKIGVGLSYYHGEVYQGTENVYTMQGSVFRLDNHPDNKGKYAKREYFGIDGQLAFASSLGKSKLHAEYLYGQQPGAQLHTKSHSASSLPIIDTYIRDFRGGYLMFVQGLGKLPVSAVVKYDWYDPNTRAKGDEIGLNNTGLADIAVQAFGIGALWQINEQLLLQGYYQINKNEQSANLPEYTHDRKDNTFTLRAQYLF